MREVPRNIDAPSRAPEFAITSLVAYYGVQYLTSKPLFAFITCILANYIVYRVTIGKPEGAAFRLMYKMGGLNKMVKSPKKVKKFEI